LLAFIFFIVTFLFSLSLSFLIPSIIDLFESIRVEIVIITLISANILAHIQIIKSYFYSKKNQKSKNTILLKNTPKRITHILKNLEKELGIKQSILLLRTEHEFYTYRNKGKIIIAIPYLSLLTLEDTHLEIILKHELLHHKHWDTSFDIWFEKSYELLKKTKQNLEFKNLSTFNPLYWLVKIVLFFQTKAYELRKKIAEKIIDKIISKTEKNIYEEAISRTFLSDILFENINSIQLEEESNMLTLFEEVLKFKFEELNNIHITEDRFINLKLDTSINWKKVCLTDNEIEKFYEEFEILILTEIFKNYFEFKDGNKEVLSDEKSASEKKLKTDEIHPILHNLNYVLTRSKWSEILLEPFEIDREFAWKSDQYNNKFERIYVIETPKGKEKFWNTSYAITNIGEYSHERFMKRVLCFYFIIVDSFDDVSVDTIIKKTHKYYPSTIMLLLSYLTVFLPIGFKCGGIIPVFISKDKDEFYYKLPAWALLKRLTLIGLKYSWEESIEKEPKNIECFVYENETVTPITKRNSGGNWWITKKGFVFLGLIIGIGIIAVYNSDFDTSLKTSTLGIFIFVAGFTSLSLNYPLLYNNLVYLSSYGKQSQKFKNEEEKNEFVELMKKNMFTSKYVSFSLIIIGVILLIFSSFL
jgi:hypothetical protein